MKKFVLCCVLLAAVVAGVSKPASAGELKLTMQDGRVTLQADNVPVRQILQEWARIGQARIVNLDRLSGPNLTIQLIDVPERDALDILLRSASGYIAAPRSTPVANAAMFDRVTIFVSTARPPAQVAGVAPPPTFQQRPPQPDDDEPINVAMPQQFMNPVNGQFPGAAPQSMPGMSPQAQQFLQQQQQMLQQQQVPTTSPVPGPLTAPRPGALPQPAMPGGVPNPYQPVPVKPGGGGPGDN